MSRLTRAQATPGAAVHLGEAKPLSSAASARTTASRVQARNDDPRGSAAVPEFIAPEDHAEYLAGWHAGRLAAERGPLPFEVARDVVLIVEASNTPTGVRVAA